MRAVTSVDDTLALLPHSSSSSSLLSRSGLSANGRQIFRAIKSDSLGEADLTDFDSDATVCSSSGPLVNGDTHVEELSSIADSTDAAESFPTIEIFPEGADILALHRCGFCSYETYGSEEFSEHVTSTHAVRPMRCGYCLYASFSRGEVVNHCAEVHLDRSVSVQELVDSYTMSMMGERTRQVDGEVSVMGNDEVKGGGEEVCEFNLNSDIDTLMELCEDEFKTILSR